jgi:hypothetical protein
VLAHGADGRVRVLRSHRRPASCGLVRSFGLRRPVFSERTPLAGSYRLAAPARVSLTVTRGRKVVERFATAERRSFRFALRGLPRGSYTVRLVARSGEDQVSAAVRARRL